MWDDKRYICFYTTYARKFANSVRVVSRALKLWQVNDRDSILVSLIVQQLSFQDKNQLLCDYCHLRLLSVVTPSFPATVIGISCTCTKTRSVRFSSSRITRSEHISVVAQWNCFFRAANFRDKRIDTNLVGAELKCVIFRIESFTVPYNQDYWNKYQ